MKKMFAILLFCIVAHGVKIQPLESDTLYFMTFHPSYLWWGEGANCTLFSNTTDAAIHKCEIDVFSTIQTRIENSSYPVRVTFSDFPAFTYFDRSQHSFVGSYRLNLSKFLDTKSKNFTRMITSAILYNNLYVEKYSMVQIVLQYLYE